MANSVNKLRGVTWTAILGLGLALGACSRLDAPGGSGSGTTPAPLPTFSGSASAHMSAGLNSIAPEVNRLRVRWQTNNLDSFSGDFALYISTLRSGLYSTTPIPLDISLGSFVFTGLLDQTEYFVGLALASTAGGTLIPMGQALSAKTGRLFYVDSMASAMGADGLSPATAFPLIFPAIITAFLTGGGNVLVREGSFADSALPLLAGVDMYGGYSADFALENRDPALQPTRLLGLAGSSILSLEALGALQRVDGFHMDGLGVASNGIDLDQTPAQLTNLHIQGCARGLRLRSANIFDPTTVSIANLESNNNRLEGLSLQGSFSVTVDDSTFQSNAQEGFQFGPWNAPSGESVFLTVRNCRFLANGTDGFDVDLGAAPLPGLGGRFEVTIEDCDFAQNAGDGCLVDVDFETTPAWQLELSIRGSQALANGANGFALDIDSSSTCVLHRVLSSANRLDGLSLTSETYAAMVLVSASAFVGNLGYGVHSSIGNVGVALSHSLLIGNALGGLRDELAPASLASSASHLQFSAFGSAHLRGSLNLPDSPSPFIYAAIEYRNLNAQSGSVLTLDSALSSGLGAAVELGADGILRVLDASAATSVQVTPTPAGMALPTLFALFPASNSVDEDYSAQIGSALLGAGMQPPMGTSVDAGPFGSPAAGAPGIEDLFPIALFRVSAQLPAWGQSIAANGELRLSFEGGAPDPASLAAGLRAVDSLGNPLVVSSGVQASELVIQAPAGGWQSGDLIELHGTITASGSGTALIPITLLVGAS